MCNALTIGCSFVGGASLECDPEISSHWIILIQESLKKGAVRGLNSKSCWSQYKQKKGCPIIEILVSLISVVLNSTRHPWTHPQRVALQQHATKANKALSKRSVAVVLFCRSRTSLPFRWRHPLGCKRFVCPYARLQLCKDPRPYSGSQIAVQCGIC